MNNLVKGALYKAKKEMVLYKVTNVVDDSTQNYKRIWVGQFLMFLFSKKLIRFDQSSQLHYHFLFESKIYTFAFYNENNSPDKTKERLAEHLEKIKE